MVPSSALAIATDRECLSCGDISLGETIHFGSLVLIANYFGNLSLSPWRDGSDAVAMGSTHSGPPSLLRAMTRDSTEEFHMTSDGEGGAQPPLTHKARHGGFAHPCHNHVVAREQFDHSGDDDNSTTAGNATAGHRLPFQAVARSSGRETSTSTSPHPATPRQAGDNGTMERASRWASNRHDPAV
jgi:hypothetical protein